MNELDALSVGEWWQYKYPFKHYRVTNPLTAGQYRSIAAAFSEILRGSVSNRTSTYKLKQSTANYDVEMLAMNAELAPRFQPLFNSAWLKSIARFIGIPYTNRLDGALHSAPINSRTGWIHTDCCSAWFDTPTPASADAVIFADRTRCDYFSGAPRVPDAKPVEYVRAVTLLFYLCNEDWKPGDGGETGLYSAAKESARSRSELVPPHNNTLLIFECSPHSYHRFITNPGRRRNSIILWLHGTPEFVNSKWGAGAVHRIPRA